MMKQTVPESVDCQENVDSTNDPLTTIGRVQKVAEKKEQAKYCPANYRCETSGISTGLSPVCVVTQNH